jgi:transcriptional regulator with XRE-family HTH domain
MCIIIHFMQNVASQLVAFMEREGLKQSTLAENAEVSQSTVSRALRGQSLRRGSAKSRLFKYAGIAEPAGALSKTEASQRLAKAFDQIWDESDVHADAIARIITVLAELGTAVRSRRR